MQNNDVELIHRILDGDDTAFTEIVNKYKKSVHALVWRKIGDFHIAEEITQDTFLKAYQKLSTLKSPQRFASWLYVIASRRCLAWQRRKRILTKSLEETNSAQIEKETYSQYVANENTRITAETQRDVVKKLLAKLPESERTIITLHYFSEMSSSEIGAFLGVSANTIRSRLRRAQQRLQKEETMIREALDHFKLSPNITDNIMQEISRLKPTPSTIKPLVPWAIAATSAVLIVLLLGIGSQNLVRFQQPYTLDAQAEMTVEIVDAPIVLNVDVKPDVRNQLGTSNALGISEHHGQKPDDVLLAAAEIEDEDKISTLKQQWIQSEPIKGSQVYSLKGTTQGDLYVLVRNLVSPHILKLTSDGNTWQSMDGYPSGTVWGFNVPMVEWNNTFYIIPSNELFASKDEGKTWNSLYTWPKEHNIIDFLPMDNAFYAAFHEGIYRSDDSGKTWQAIHDEQIEFIVSLTKIQNTLFVETSNSLYRLDDDGLNSLEFPVVIRSIISVAGTDGKLYVAVTSNSDRSWWIFRSTDLGDTWIDITPTNAWSVKKVVPFVKLIAVGETLLISWRDVGLVRSTDSGDTWMPVQAPNSYPNINTYTPVVALNEQTFYIASDDDGLHRSIDGGKSWHAINIDRKSKFQMDDIIANRGFGKVENIPTAVYVKVGREIVKTTDKGKFWNTVQMEEPKTLRATVERPFITQIVKYGDVIYAKGGDSYGDGSRYSSGDGITRLYRISADDNILKRVPDIPIFDAKPLRYHLAGRTTNSFDSPEEEEKFIRRIQKSTGGASQFFKQLAKWDPKQPDFYMKLGFHGPLAVSDDTFYLEYNFKLFRYKKGEREWSDTGVEETVELTLDVAVKNLKLAVSGNTVYVGKRDGTLLQSFDAGTNWIDLTPTLPFPVKAFNEIVIVGNTVYVATDAGIAASDQGNNWGVVTDLETTNLVMEHLTVDGTKLYGVTKGTGIYRLENGTWNQIVSDIPENITSLAVDGNTLYVGTQEQGMLHFTFED